MLQCSGFKRFVYSLTACLSILVCVALAPAGAFAQNTSNGTVVGQITDAQGKAIVGAVVMINNTATNSAEPTVTNNQGRYAFVALTPGQYSLDVKKDGFKEAIVKNQTVVAGKPLTLNVSMQVGAATQTVEVTATGAELQTMNATLGESISGAAIVALPNLNRDANSLTSLQPNTQPDGGVGGAVSDQNSYTLNGANNSNDMDGSNAVYTNATGGMSSGVMPTPAESIETFTVAVSNQSASVNSAAGSSVAMVTKRGTDSFHGAAYDYYLGSYLGANDWANNGSFDILDSNNTPASYKWDPVARPKGHRNRFGFDAGGPILPNFLGGKTYLFGLFEGLRYPNSEIFKRAVPSALLRAGVVQASPDASQATPVWNAYNLNPATVTVGGTAYQPANCGTVATPAPCDPRGIGMNPVVAALWSKYMPLPNLTSGGDQHNTANYASNLDISSKSNFLVMRMDHDFGSKNHLNVVYNFYSYNPITANQVDIGGALPGDTFGQAKSTTQRPELPTLTSANWSSSLTPNITNNFNASYLRHYWEWLGSNLNPQVVPGFGPLGGALEIGGESNGNAQIPYNVNTQSVRTRWWDGIGETFSDDVSWIHGNHLFSFGGKYTHQWDYHSRNDNGGGIMANNVYQIGNGTGQSGGGGVNFLQQPADFTANADTATFDQFYAETMGIVTQPQTLYTRNGPQLTLQPLGTHATDKSTIPMYNVYFSDAWHMKPSLTLTYGAGYTIEMPPHEEQGKQVQLVDAAGNPIDYSSFIANTERAALAGQDYNPTLGFATVNNIGGGEKYPYRPFYGGFSPRVSLAWNPNINDWFFGGNKTVIRGGWSRIYGRLNGVDLVLVPLLGTGLMQPVSCIGATTTGACGGNGGATPLTAFRIGVDGLSAPLGAPPVTNLPQPYYPGTIQNGVVNPAAGSGEFLDPNFRPNRSDEFDLTWQRQLSPTVTTEVGYTGRIIRDEYQGVNLGAVPYMMTAGGQQFSQAFANLFQEMASGGAITAQPFFEAALGGTGSAYCGSTSCTAAVAAAEGTGTGATGNINPAAGNNVYGLWADLNGSSSWTLGRTFPSAPTTCNTPGRGGCPTNTNGPGGTVGPITQLSGGGQLSAIYDNASIGWGNYNSLFWSVAMRGWHGLTLQSNLTFSKSLGTGQTTQSTSEYTVTNPYDMHYMYGPQGDTVPLQYNFFFVYTPGGSSQNGLIQHLTHGWSFAPIFTYQTIGNNFFFGGTGGGGLTQVSTNGLCASFGETDCSTGSTIEGAIMVGGVPAGRGLNVVNPTTSTGSQSDASQGGNSLNMFANPAAAYKQFRAPVLGLDTTGQSGYVPGVGSTNVDFAVTKDINLGERLKIELNGQATNVFNHFVPFENFEQLGNPTGFGTIGGNSLSPRTVEIGSTIRW